MQVTVVTPSARLVPFVRRFTVVETRDEASRVLLPEHGLILGVRFGGSASLVKPDAAIRMPGLSLAGIVGAARRMRTAAGGGVVLAMFRETGAARFFAEPLHELFDRTIPLEQIAMRADLARLEQQIGEAPDHAHRIARLEEFLIARLRPETTDPLADAAVVAIRRSRGALRIAELARELGISQDPLEKRFRRVVGTSPKQLASLVRLTSVIEARRTVGAARTAGRGTRAPESWSRLAVAAGYFDQSHFNREFRALTGESPARFFQADGYC
jgi:AraC-like DNA-binding protein